jgi:hypothetical protein
VLVRFYHVARIIVNANHSNCPTLSYNFGVSAQLVTACAARRASAACGGFGFVGNTAATFDVFYWLQVKNFDVRLLNSAPNGPDYIDIVGLCFHAQLFRSNLLMNRFLPRARYFCCG